MMTEASPAAGGRFKILHVLRAPLGGLFRHVLDLAREQIDRGHAVGLVTDSSTGGAFADRVLGELAPRLVLGLLRLPMRRNPSPADLLVSLRLAQHIRRVEPTVVHGHGSKGGLYARMTSLLPHGGSTLRAYTPHGGSLNYRPGSPTSRVFMLAERLMALRTDLLLFESAFVADRYRRQVGEPASLWRVVHNGIAPSEFLPIVPRADAVDIVYVGELRTAKGIDTLLTAMKQATQSLRRPIRAVLAGTGPDHAMLVDLVRQLDLVDAVTFAGSVPAREAFARGRLLVVPSRAESLPYVVLEAAAARIPIIATRVGGVPEIFGPLADRLLAPDDVSGLAARIVTELSRTPKERAAEADSLAAVVEAGFSLSGMADAVIAAYREAATRKARPRHSAQPAATVSFNPPEA